MTGTDGDPSVPAVAESGRDRTPTALLKVTSEQLEVLRAENERLAKELIDTTTRVDGVNAELDRLSSLLVVERAIFESELALVTRELEALRQTKLLRYTAGLRKAYGTTRRALHPILRHR